MPDAIQARQQITSLRRHSQNLQASFLSDSTSEAQNMESLHQSFKARVVRRRRVITFNILCKLTFVIIGILKLPSDFMKTERN